MARLFPPIVAPVVDPKTGLVTQHWTNYFNDVTNVVTLLQPGPAPRPPAVPPAEALTFENLGLRVKDEGPTYTLTFQPLGVYTDHLTLGYQVGNADRVLTLMGNPTLADWFDQSVKTTASPSFAALTAGYLDLPERVAPAPGDPPAATARLHSLDVNGYTAVEVRDANANVVRLASDNVMVAKVAVGGGIARGQVVFLSGANGANPLIGLAKADALATMPALGLALDPGANNAFIRVLLGGTIQLLDTSAFAEGARVFVSPTTAGALTTTLPTAPNFAQRVGMVTRSHATQGEIVVVTTGVDASATLPANVAFLNVAQTWTALQTLSAGLATSTLTVNGFPITVTGAATLPGGLPPNVAFTNTAQTFTALQTFSSSIVVNGVNWTTWFDQSVRQDAFPSFNGLTIAGHPFTVTGNPTLNDWFDQNVKTTAFPTFAGITINGHGFTVNGNPTLDDWFNQNVKTTASPTFNILSATRYDQGGSAGVTASTRVQVQTGPDWFLEFRGGVCTFFGP